MSTVRTTPAYSSTSENSAGIISDLEIQILWHLFESAVERNEPLHIADLTSKIGGEISPVVEAAHILQKKGLLVSRWFVCHLTTDGRMALLSLVCAGMCRSLIAKSFPSASPSNSGIGAEGGQPSAPVISIWADAHARVFGYAPQECGCGRPKVRACDHCDKPICNHCGYQLQPGEPGSPVLCSECKGEAGVESAAEIMYGRAGVRG